MPNLEQATDISPSGGVGTSPITLVPDDQNRKYLLIQNVSDTIYIGLALHGTVPSVSTTGLGGVGTMVLPPGGGITFDAGKIPANSFMAIASGGSANPVTVIQW